MIYYIWRLDGLALVCQYHTGYGFDAVFDFLRQIGGSAIDLAVLADTHIVSGMPVFTADSKGRRAEGEGFQTLLGPGGVELGGGDSANVLGEVDNIDDSEARVAVFDKVKAAVILASNRGVELQGFIPGLCFGAYLFGDNTSIG